MLLKPSQGRLTRANRYATEKWNLAVILMSLRTSRTSDSNEFKKNTEASFECPMQHSYHYYFEPLYPRSGAYYCIMINLNFQTRLFMV